MKSGCVLVLAVLAMAPAAPAWASYSEVAAGLQCRDNTIAIRFGRADNGGDPVFDPLPQKYDAAWASVAVSNDNRCTLANGDRVELHAGIGTAYPWGMGGGDPDGFISLWINGRKVVAREVYYHGYGSREPARNSFFLSGNLIERCTYTDSKQTNVGIVCSAKQIDIAALPLDPLLPSPAEQALVGTYRVSGIYSQEFCGAFVQKPRGGGEVTWESVSTPDEAQFFHQSQPDNGEQGSYLRPSYRVDRFDLWNRGRADTVVQYSGDWKFFNGDVYFYWEGVAPDAVVDALQAELAKGSTDLGPLVEFAHASGWRTLPEMPDAVVHWMPFRLSGLVFVLESPAYTGRIAVHRPSYAPQIGPRLDPICEFRLVEEYF